MQGVERTRTRRSWKKFLWRKRCLIAKMQASGKSGSEIERVVAAFEISDWNKNGGYRAKEIKEPIKLPIAKKKKPKKRAKERNHLNLIDRCIAFSEARDKEFS